MGIEDGEKGNYVDKEEGKVMDEDKMRMKQNVK